MSKALYDSQDAAPAHTAVLPVRQAAFAQPHHRFGKTIPLSVAACVLLAVICVLLIPLLVGGAEPAQSHLRTAADSGVRLRYGTWQEAAAVLNLSPGFPAELPEGFNCTGYYVTDGKVLEAEFTAGAQRAVLRVTAGNEDLSGADYDALAYTATEAAGDSMVGYAGVSEKKLTCAVWVDAHHAYALVAADGMDAALMKALAQGLAG